MRSEVRAEIRRNANCEAGQKAGVKICKCLGGLLSPSVEAYCYTPRCETGYKSVVVFPPK